VIPICLFVLLSTAHRENAGIPKRCLIHSTDSRLPLKCDGTRAETRFRLSAKRTSSFKSAGTSVQSSTGSRVVRISGSNAGYTMFRGSVKGTGYAIHSPVSPSLPLPCVTMCHHISTGVYQHHSATFTANIACSHNTDMLHAVLGSPVRSHPARHHIRLTLRLGQLAQAPFQM